MADAGTAQRKLAAIMFTDVVGYTALTQRNEALAIALLDEHQRLLRPIFARHGGREINTTGDGFLVEFASALEAARCACEIQKALVEHNASATADRRIHIRIGLHVGDVVEREGDVFGDGVNIASRIVPLAEPGGVCLSRPAYDQIHNKVDVPLVRLGQAELKGVEVPMEVYRVLLPWTHGVGSSKVPGSASRRVTRAWAFGLASVVVLMAVTWWFWPPAATKPSTGASSSQPAVAGTPPKTRPVLWVLSVGVSRYKAQDISLQFADEDARAVAAALQEQGQGAVYSEVRVRLLMNEEVTRESILKGIERFLGQAGPSDVAVIFMAGHGVQDRATGSYYFLPYPANAENLLTEGLRMSDFDEMVRLLRRNVGRVVVMLDTCHAGALRLASRAVASADDLATQVSVAEGLFLLAATKPGEESKETPELGHGAFTYALLEGLNGAADTRGDGLVSVSDLFGYVARRVPRLTEGRQHPYHKMEGTDLTFAAIGHGSKDVELASPTAGIAGSLQEAAVTPVTNAIGVMECHNLRADPEHDWVAKALRAALNTELSKVRRLHVYSPELIDRTSKLFGADDLRTARQLGISKLVIGSFIVVGYSVRIDARIVDAASGVNQGSDSAQGNLDEFFEVEKKLVLSILRRLPVSVSPTEGKSIEEETNTDVNAYRLLLEAEGVAEEPTPSSKRRPASRARGPGEEPQSQLWDHVWPIARGLWASAHAADAASPIETEVRQVLEAYRRAHEQKDLDALAALYVSFSARQREALSAYLDNADALTVELTDVMIEPRDDGVVVSYTRRDRFVDTESGRSARLEVRLTKILVREGGKWKIAGGA